jgi:hypothetical protein
MTTSNGAVGDQVEGLVEACNDRGIRVAGEWRNLSKFHPLDLPERGARVRLELDPKGFIRTLQVLDAAPLSTSSSDRDRTISRLAVLKAAAEFSANRAEIKSADVLKIASTWLTWVEEEGGV